MASRQICRRITLRAIASAPSSPAARGISNLSGRATAGTKAAGVRVAGRLRFEAAAAARRWYVAPNENAVPGSRIWKYDEIEKLLEGQGEDVVIIDVREPQELFETGKIPGAINIPITSAVQSFHLRDEDFEALYGFARPPKEATLLFYCRAGVRARAAAGLAQHAGWASVGEFPGSWLEWDANRGPVEKVEAVKGFDVKGGGGGGGGGVDGNGQ